MEGQASLWSEQHSKRERQEQMLRIEGKLVFLKDRRKVTEME